MGLYIACEGVESTSPHKGGYSLDSISNSALAVAKILLGEAPPMLPPMEANTAATETVWQVAVEQSKYWKSISPKAAEPREGKHCSLNYFSHSDMICRIRRGVILNTG